MLRSIIPYFFLLMTTLDAILENKVENKRECTTGSCSLTDEQRLLSRLLQGYSKYTRPVHNASHPVDVQVGITLTQIFDVDERNQVLTINVWLDQEWHDEKLKWDPKEYNGLTVLRIPCALLWLPDIVLYNSASDYNEKYMEALAMVSNDGTVFWPPIVKLRSTCLMDVTYFPFDDQICKLKIGSWAYDGHQVDVKILNRSNSIDLSLFVENGEWELVSARAVRNVVVYPCCDTPYPDVTFKLHIRRRTTYYLYNVIIPSVMLSSLALLGFWMHPDSGEKVTLGLTVLLALSVFMLLIAENTPATSFYVPLLGVYLIMAMSFTSLSVIFAVIVSNFHARGTSPKKLPQGLRSFTIFISKILCMKLNHLSAQFPASWTYSACQIPVLNGNKSNTPSMNGTSSGCVKIKDDTTEPLSEENNPPMSKFNYLVLDSLKCLIEKHEERERESHLKGQWEEAAKVMDRFLFWLFLCGMISSTLYLLLILPLTKTQTVNTGET